MLSFILSVHTDFLKIHMLHIVSTQLRERKQFDREKQKRDREKIQRENKRDDMSTIHINVRYCKLIYRVFIKHCVF